MKEPRRIVLFKNASDDGFMDTPIIPIRPTPRGRLCPDCEARHSDALREIFHSKEEAAWIRNRW